MSVWNQSWGSMMLTKEQVFTRMKSMRKLLLAEMNKHKDQPEKKHEEMPPQEQ